MKKKDLTRAIDNILGLFFEPLLVIGAHIILVLSSSVMSFSDRGLRKVLV